MNDTIGQLKELKQRFEKLYEDKIKNTNTEELIAACLEYLDYRYEFGKNQDTQGNAAMRLNSFVKNSENTFDRNFNGQIINLIGIIKLLDQKIELLSKDQTK